MKEMDFNDKQSLCGLIDIIVTVLCKNGISKTDYDVLMKKYQEVENWLYE